MSCLVNCFNHRRRTETTKHKNAARDVKFFSIGYNTSMDKDEQKDPIRILSVEDDEFIRLFLKDVLWIHGVKDNLSFASAETTDKARDLIQDPLSRPALILLDLMLPVNDGGKSDLENGISLLEKIKT